MSYDYPRIHKAEENIEHQVTDWVYEHVCEFFGVDDISELTEDQISEVEAFRNELNEYSPMQIGYSNVLGQWDMENYDEG